MSMNAGHLPKTIWFLWLQGYGQCPDRSKRCLLSWKKWNPDWKIVFLSSDNLNEYLPDLKTILGKNEPVIKAQALSDIIRINLLHRYGGVWADATCLCRKPLDEWIQSCMEGGFFAFRNPGRDRMISSWFLASEPDSFMAGRLCAAVNSYWGDNRFFWGMPSRLGALVNWNVFLPILWSSHCVTKILHAYPYYWFHYLFARQYFLNSSFRRQWETVPRHEAGPLLQFNSHMHAELDSSAKDWIDHSDVPCFKLSSLNVLPTDPIQTIQDYLLEPYIEDVSGTPK